MTTTIALHGASDVAQVARSDVYFPFASGRFSYDCATCGAQCCRGHGYLARTDPELSAQLAERPFARFFVVDERAPYKEVHNCPPGCFFLSAGNLCTVQIQRGYSAKPETCRLFPFNDLRRVHSFLIAGQHISLCPLRVLPRGERSPLSDHARLLQDMQSHGVRSPVARLEGDVEVGKLIALERQLVDDSELHAASAGYAAFVHQQLRRTREIFARSVEGRERPIGDDIDVAAHLKSLVAVLATDERAFECDAATVDVLTATTPFLRAHVLFGVQRQDLSLASRDPARVAIVTLATSILVAFARLAGMEKITFQTVSHVFRANQSLIALLSYLPDRMTWRPDAQIDLKLSSFGENQRDYYRIAQALLPAWQKSANRSLAEVLCENTKLSGVERILFLRRVAERLFGNLVRAPMTKRLLGRGSVRARVQRIALSHIGADTAAEASRLLMKRTRSSV